MHTDPSLFFDAGGRLREPLVAWLQQAFGYDPAVVRYTRFKKAARLPYHARTFYRTVWYQDPDDTKLATHTYSVRNWLNLIVHEMFHRTEIGNNPFSAARFGISYGWYWLKNRCTGKDPYFDNPHEERAYEMGCGSGSRVDRLLAEDPGLADRLTGMGNP